MELTHFDKGLLSVILLSEDNHSVGKFLAEPSSDLQYSALVIPTQLLYQSGIACFILLLLSSNTEKLADRKLNVAEVTQSEIGQKQKLQTVLEAVHDLLRPHGWTIKWNVDCKDISMVLSQLHR